MIDIEYVSGMVIHGLLLLLKNSELPFTKFTVRYSGYYEFMREKLTGSEMVSGSVKLTASLRVSFEMNSMAFHEVILLVETFFLSLFVTLTSSM